MNRQRLHPLTPLVRGAKLVAAAAVVISWQGLRDLGPLGWLASMAGILIVAVLVSAVIWLVTGYEVVGRELRVHEGLLSRRTRTIPLERVQAIDIVRPALARVFGLAELRLEVIGAGKTEAPLAYLTVAGASELRGRLLGLATGVAPDPVSRERPVFTALNRRLLLAQLLTPQALAVPVGAAFVIWQATLDPTWTIIGAASTVTAFLGAFQVPVRRVLDEWDFHLGVDAAVFRVRQGLLNKRSQTVPPRRVQGLKITWPLLWRAPGWSRARIDVAGYGGDGEEQLRAGTLVPVAASADTAGVAAMVLGVAVTLRPHHAAIDATAVPVTGPPSRARWLAPLAWSRIGVGVTDDVVAVREGVLTRELVAVPLARVQSVRVTQGPLQRLLTLATVHVDTAGGLHAVARHRDALDAYALADDLARRSRAARQTFLSRARAVAAAAAVSSAGPPSSAVSASAWGDPPATSSPAAAPFPSSSGLPTAAPFPSPAGLSSRSSPSSSAAPPSDSGPFPAASPSHSGPFPAAPPPHAGPSPSAPPPLSGPSPAAPPSLSGPFPAAPPSSPEAGQPAAPIPMVPGGLSGVGASGDQGQDDTDRLADDAVGDGVVRRRRVVHDHDPSTALPGDLDEPGGRVDGQ
ncbi:hypothetical protein GCM10007977_013150 [Dactylosporangium sucinum]|uniref:YdbS-like PH domain-containing protein n=1 Tax=Dactylosporangium sucinum TaxID=1424081 RepID=A0A917T7F5_9ACTN|nr:hypothetical protein GCM10007977_013150 [Dactylosporangium sucinum]